MLQQVWHSLQSLWKRLLMTDLLFKGIAFVLLTPVVSLLFRGFLGLSGQTILADEDIAHFLLNPIGWITLIIVGTAIVGILALEQSVLMAISLADAHERRLSVWDSLQFVGQRGIGVFQITARMAMRLLLLAAPFVAAGGAVYLLLLTDHDINFYLAQKPPRFWVAATLIGAILATLAALVIRCVVHWSIAIQLHLFENVPPSDCLTTSRDRVVGHRRVITRWVVIWAAVNLVISLVASALVFWIGRNVVPATAGGLWTLVFGLGIVILLWAVVNLGTSLLAVISFAVLQGHVYDRFGRSEAFVLPAGQAGQPSWAPTWTRGRILSAVALAVIGSALLGAAAIHMVSLSDDVSITAHRGASGNAPENTLAAVQRAIDDGTDWVEIDVQESKDGVVVVAHDSDLKKVAGADVRIWEATADELRGVDIGSYFGPEFQDERVPTLAEVLTACRGKAGLNIELKYYGHDQDLERKVVELVEEHGMESDVVVMSLKAEGIQKVKALRPDWTVGLLTAVVAGDLTRADADFLAVNTKLATRPFIRSAHERGKKVYVWTVNDPITMSTMISRGADNLITDHPALARKVLKEREGMSPVERLLVRLAFLFGAGWTPSPEQ